MLYKLATMDRINFYSNAFPLSSDLSFNDFIQVLENENFSPYRLLVDQIPLTNNYHLEFESVFIPLLDRPILADWRFLDKCTLRCLHDKKTVELNASISTGWFLFYIMISGLFIFGSIYFFIITGLAFSLLIIAFIVTFFLALYRRDIHRFNKISSLAIKDN